MKKIFLSLWCIPLFLFANQAAASNLPVVTSFDVPLTSTSLTVPVTLTASDDGTVSGYMLTETSTPPLAGDSGWSASAPTNYTFSQVFSNTWIQKGSQKSWHLESVVASADGQKLAGIVFGGYIYTSIDGGINWTERTNAGSRNWSIITSSADGMKLVAAVSHGYVYVSVDGGETWAEKTSLGSYNIIPAYTIWYSITSSADGARVAVSIGSAIFTSEDSGSTWRLSSDDSSTMTYQKITSSADGLKLAATAYNQNSGSRYIYTSVNGGLTWTQLANPDSLNWSLIKYSDSGNKLIASTSEVDSSGYIYTSDNDGVTWTKRTNLDLKYWNSITSSADGKRLSVVDYLYTGICLYHSNDGGTTWIKNATISVERYAKVISYNDGLDLILTIANANYLKTSSLKNRLYAWAKDNEGQISQLSSNFVVIDATPPVISSFLSPATSSSLTIPVTITATDNNEITGYIITETEDAPALNDNNWVSQSPTTWTLKSSGAITLYAWTKDYLGNISSSVTSGTEINLPPVISSFSTPDTSVSLTVPVTLTASDDGSVDGYMLNETLTPPLASDPNWSVSAPTSYTFSGANKLFPTSWTQVANSRTWQSITSSADGIKLAAVVNGGYIYTSIDSGTTWTERAGAGSRAWTSITSSADGLKLAATVNGGYIYTSVDGGENWVSRTSVSPKAWTSITSSADGLKLAVAVNGGYIYNSIDGGATWVLRNIAGSRAWTSVTSSADGQKVAATVNNGYIYTSVDGGVSWVSRTSAGSKTWTSITSSADGLKLAATVNNGYIYTSVDGGVSWTERANVVLRAWQSITSSADGLSLAAAVSNGYVYTSIDGGISWIERTGAGLRNWKSITSSFDGSNLALASNSGYIYTSKFKNILYAWTKDNIGQISEINSKIILVDNDLPIISSFLAPTTFSSPIIPVTITATDNNEITGYIITETEDTPALNNNNWVSQSPTTWTLKSSDTITLYAWTKDYIGNISLPLISNTANVAIGTLPVVTSFSAPATSTSLTVPVTFTASDDGVAAGYLITETPTPPVAENSNWSASAPSSYTFSGANKLFPSNWSRVSDSRTWQEITSSADGMKLAAVVNGGYIYTSIDGGVTWTERTNAGSRTWQAITSSADGMKLAAVVNNGYIYISTNGGETWTEITSVGSRTWREITSSADGTKLATFYGNGPAGYIYTSADGGETWVERTSAGLKGWTAITSSADGTKIVAAISGAVYISTDSGDTWQLKEVYGSVFWQSITSSADGMRLTVVAGAGPVFYSYDGGETWLEVTGLGSGSWSSITSSADGMKLAVTDRASNKYIYTSIDGGKNWVKRADVGLRTWQSITSSSDGTKLIAAAQGDYIYTLDFGNKLYPWVKDNDGQVSEVSTSSVLLIDIELPVVTSFSVPATSTSLIIPVTIVASDNNHITDYIITETEAVPSLSNAAWVSTAPTTWKLKSYKTTTLYAWTKDSLSLVSLPVTATVSIDSLPVITSFNLPATSTSLTVPVTLTASDDGTVTGYMLTETSTPPLPSDANWELTPPTSYTFSVADKTYPNSWHPGGSSGSWRQITSSADGMKLAAVNYGYIYTSTDGGINWQTRTSAGNKEWALITSSADGTKLAAVGNRCIYTSDDGGEIWTKRTGINEWYSITSSADGTKLAAVVFNGPLYTSADSGETWIVRTGAGSRSWTSITSSADGTKLAAVNANGGVYTSADSGETWTEKIISNSSNRWQITSSADGTKLAAAANGGSIYTSVDGGVSWVERTAAGSKYWYSITSSADGMRLSVSVMSGYIYTSINGGKSWTERSDSGSRHWYSITSSSDGTKIIATGIGENVYATGFGNRLYSWVKDDKNQISGILATSVSLVDTEVPVMRSFSAPARSSSLTIPVTVTATDNNEISGYAITETDNAPAFNDTNWVDESPTVWTLESPETTTLYAWAKDSLSLMSSPMMANVLITSGSAFIPKDLSYTSPNTFNVNQTITSLAPIITGDDISYSVSPELPTGLSLDLVTGVISGTPTAVSNVGTYIVTATNNAGSVTFDLVIGVKDVLLQPSYNSSNFIGVNKEVVIEQIGGQSSSAIYTISPSLPRGLILNSTSGYIYGSPAELSNTKTYTVTVTNVIGSASTTLDISVLMPWVPVGENVSKTPASSSSYITFSKNGVPYVVYVDTNSATIVTRYDSVQKSWVKVGNTVESQSSNQKIVLDGADTPYISYTDSTGQVLVKKYNGASWELVGSRVSDKSYYQDLVIDKNNNLFVAFDKASVSGELVIKKYFGAGDYSVNNANYTVAPNNLSYSNNNIYAPNSPINPLYPTVTGSVKTYSVSPNLPVGLNINSGTGVISGTPTEAVSETIYVVTATNNSGSTSFNLKISVLNAWMRLTEDLLGSNPFDLLADSAENYYVPYDDAVKGKIIKKYNASSGWSDFDIPNDNGNPVSIGSISIDNDNLYVVCTTDNSGRVFIQKFDIQNSSWSIFSGDLNFNETTQSYDVITVQGIYFGNNSKAYFTYSYNQEFFVKKYNGNTWDILGGATAHYGNGEDSFLAIDNNGVVYITYYDENYFATVAKYDNEWSVIKTLSTFDVLSTDLKIDKDNNVYFSYETYENDVYEGQVEKYNGESWSVVGDRLPFDAWPSKLAITASGTPYLYAYNYDEEFSIVEKYDGSAWVPVSGEINNIYWNNYIYLFNNNPVILIYDGDKFYLSKYSSDINIPESNSDYTVAPTSVSYPTPVYYNVGAVINPVYPNVVGSVSSYSASSLPDGLSLDSATGAITGTPTTASSKTVYTITASNVSGQTTATIEIAVVDTWMPLGGNISSNVDSVDLDIDSANNLYVAYSDASDNFLGKVKKYNGTSWEQLGGQVAETEIYPSLAINGTDIYVTYFEDTTSKLFVKKYNATTTEWELFGDSISFTADPNTFNLDFDTTGNIFIIFSTADVTTVKTWKNNSWQDTGGSLTPAYNSQLAITGNKLYISYTDDDDNLVVKNYEEFTNSGSGREVSLNNITNLISEGIMSPYNGTPGSTTIVKFNQRINVVPFSGASIVIPVGVTMTASSSFNTVALTASTADVSDLTAITSAGSLMFGLPNLGLTLSSSITITIPVTGFADGRILKVYTKTAGDSWKELTECSVLNSKCSFQTTHLSEFAAGTSTTSSSTVGSSSPVIATTCVNVTYGDFSPICASGYQYRNFTTQTPLGCSLSAAQIEAARRLCGAVTPVSTSTNNVTNPVLNEIKAKFIALEKSLVKTINNTLTKRLLGRILLQVEEKGEAWYVNPTDSAKYFLGTPSDAFNLMRKLALGINNKTFNSFKNNIAPARLAGRILLNVEDSGKAYYVNPANLKLHYLGRPNDAFQVMRGVGLGTNNINLRQIKVGEVK